MKEEGFYMEGIKKLNKAIKILKEHVKKDINVDQIEILLHLADNEPDPVSYTTLSKLMDYPKESISMIMNILGEYYIKDPSNGDSIDSGLGIVKSFPSPQDSEDHIAFLTAKGTKVVWMLNELIR